MARQDTADRLQASLDRKARRRGSMPPPQVLVVAPEWQVESGGAQPFHAASVGKLMTATVIAILIERGRLDFDTPIGDLLPAADVDGLPAKPGVDVATSVTVDQLLTHTSGIPDFFEPPRGSETDCSIKSVVADRDRRWTPAELLDQARKLPAVGLPGERFHYADTGYVLLGRIAEEATGEEFNALLQNLIFEPSAMAQSSTPYGQARTGDDLAAIDVAPFWLGGHELSRALAVSLDWAGGNIVAPAADFVRFQQALHAGRLISPATLTRLALPRRRFRRGIAYGAGTMTLRFGEFFPPLRGLPQPVGHLGVWATHLFYYPQQDAHVVINFHSTREMNRSFLAHLRIAQQIARRQRS